MSDLQIPETLLAALVASPALVAELLDHIAGQTRDGRIARAAGVVRGRCAGRRTIDDAVLLQNVAQLVADGHTPREAIRRAAAASGGHSFAATEARLRRKWRTRILICCVGLCRREASGCGVSYNYTRSSVMAKLFRDPAPQPQAATPLPAPQDVSLATVAPAWWAASKKHAELSRRKDELINESILLHDKIDASLMFSNAETNPRAVQAERVMPPPAPKQISDDAREMLGDLVPPPAPVEPKPIEPPKPVYVHPDTRVQRLRVIGAEIAYIDEALEELWKIIQREHATGSKRLCEALESEVQAIAKQATDALVQLGNALLAQRDLLARHGSANWGFARMVPLNILELSAPSPGGSAIQEALTLAAEFGRFDLASIPSTWREPPPACLTLIELPPLPPRERYRARIRIPAPRAKQMQADVVA
jgi:hypothetical protein